jgi:hypothetical protein
VVSNTKLQTYDQSKGFCLVNLDNDHQELTFARSTLADLITEEANRLLRALRKAHKGSAPVDGFVI